MEVGSSRLIATPRTTVSVTVDHDPVKQRRGHQPHQPQGRRQEHRQRGPHRQRVQQHGRQRRRGPHRQQQVNW